MRSSPRKAVTTGGQVSLSSHGAAVGARAHFNVVQILRGLAALWVVLFHIHTFGTAQSLPLIGPVHRALFEYGRGGVAVFFVLSGFVIAHSLADTRLSARAFGQFAIRRSIRLDPPYFIAIALALAVPALIAIKRGLSIELPSAGIVAAHMLYIQEIMDIPDISVIFWTLTYELQFYLLYAAAIWAQQSLTKKTKNPVVSRIFDFIAFALAVAGSVLEPGWAGNGVFANYWFAFYLGVCVYRAVALGGSVVPALILAILMLFSASGMREVFNSPAAITGLTLLSLGISGKLAIKSPPGLTMWLGTISYSLYLTHYPTLLISLGAAQFVTANLGAFVAVTIQIFVSLAVAHAFWFLVERPSHAWSRRFVFGRRKTANAPLAGIDGMHLSDQANEPEKVVEPCASSPSH